LAHSTEIVEDDEFALCQGRRQHPFEIKGKEFAVDRAIDDPRR
jgi:hypothetical protein